MEGSSGETPPLSARVLVGGLLALHLPLAALMLPVRVGVLPCYGSLFSHAALNSPFEPDYHGRSLVLLNGQELFAAYAGVMRQVARHERTERGLDPDAMPVPGRVHLLGSFMTARTVGRVDAHTLEVVPEGGMLLTAMDRLFWGPDRTFRRGERVDRGDMEVEVVDLTEDGRPARVRYHFDRELEDPRLVWRVLVDGRLQPWVPPAVGQAVQVDASVPPLQWRPLGPLLVE